MIWGFRGFYRSKVRGFALSVLGIGFPFISAIDSLLLLTLFSPTIIFCSVVSTIYTSMPYVANGAVHFPADCQPVIFFCCHYFTNGPERAEYCARRSVGIARCVAAARMVAFAVLTMLIVVILLLVLLFPPLLLQLPRFRFVTS